MYHDFLGVTCRGVVGGEVHTPLVGMAVELQVRPAARQPACACAKVLHECAWVCTRVRRGAGEEAAGGKVRIACLW